MTTPRPSTEREQVGAINEFGGCVWNAVIGGPEEGDGVIPCPALIGLVATDELTMVPGVTVVHYDLTDDEREAIAAGGAIRLVCWSQLPVHRIDCLTRSES